MIAPMNSYTIGFTQKSAKSFFGLLKSCKATHIVDVRLNNSSQLAGFTKKNDLVYFLDDLLGWDYYHIPELAPTKDILDKYKKFKGSWDVYECEFMELMEKRRIDQTLDPKILANGCLLCSEHKPDQCHRRLVVDFLNSKWGSKINVVHLI